MYIFQKQMEISKEKLQALRELVEDTVEYFCDENRVSGEVAWTCVECLGTAKEAEVQGLLAA